MIATLFIILSIYFITIFSLIQGIRKVKKYDYDDSTPGKNKFSIVIPFRNEAQHLPELLISLSKIDYPSTHFEVIFIDDASEDKSKTIIQEFKQTSTLPIKLLDNKPYSRSPKKDAITLGVKQAIHPWIVTTDADCQTPRTWLSALDTFIDTEKAQFVAMPVLLKRKKSLVATFQYFEILGIQGVTLAAFSFKKPFLCNGANLAYKKDLFFEVNGYEGNNHLASGDDIFLLEKIRKLTTVNLTYLNTKEALVKTYPETTWTQAIEQRIRWASKTKTQKNRIAQLLGIITLLSNLSFLLSLVLIFMYPLEIVYWIFFMLYKSITDLIFLKFCASTFQEDFNDGTIVVPLLIQPYIHCWIVLHSFWGNYTWKGRKHHK